MYYNGCLFTKNPSQALSGKKEGGKPDQTATQGKEGKNKGQGEGKGKTTGVSPRKEGNQAKCKIGEPAPGNEPQETQREQHAPRQSNKTSHHPSQIKTRGGPPSANQWKSEQAKWPGQR